MVYPGSRVGGLEGRKSVGGTTEKDVTVVQVREIMKACISIIVV